MTYEEGWIARRIRIERNLVLSLEALAEQIAGDREEMTRDEAISAVITEAIKLIELDSDCLCDSLGHEEWMRKEIE